MKLNFGLINIFAHSCAAVLLASAVSPAAALPVGFESWADHSDTEDNPSSILKEAPVYSWGITGRAQGDAGTDWVWIFQKVFTGGMKSCPNTMPGNVPKNCKVTINYSGPDVEAAERIVFSMTPYPRTRLNNKNQYGQNRNLILSPTFNRQVTLKPGYYAYPTIVALDKYIPKGRIVGGFEPTGHWDWGFGWYPYPKYQRRWTLNTIGYWEGHVFAKHQQNICISKSATPPKEGSYRNDRKFCLTDMAEIKYGVIVPQVNF